MSTGVAWEEPPPEPDRPDWEAIAAKLRARPGEWLKVFEDGRASLATAIAIGHIAALRREDGFSMKTSNNTREAPRTCTLYLRWDPPKRSRRKD